MHSNTTIHVHTHTACDGCAHTILALRYVARVRARGVFASVWLFFFCGGGGALRNRSSAAQMDANERQRPRSPHTIGCGGVRGVRNLEHEVRRWVLVIDISTTNNKNKHMRPLALIKATLLRGEHERKRTQKGMHTWSLSTHHTQSRKYIVS